MDAADVIQALSAIKTWDDLLYLKDGKGPIEGTLVGRKLAPQPYSRDQKDTPEDKTNYKCDALPMGTLIVVASCPKAAELALQYTPLDQVLRKCSERGD